MGRRALRFFRDYELAHWVRGLNAEAGVAVSSSKVAFQRAQQQNCAVGDSSWKNVNGRSLGITNKQKVWIRKWRKRFSDRYKMMPARDDLAVDELRDKVRQGRDFAGRGPGFCGPGGRGKRGTGPEKIMNFHRFFDSTSGPLFRT